MADIREQWCVAVAMALNTLLQDVAPQTERIAVEALTLEKPPNPALGDIGFPMFTFARAFRMAPPAIAVAIATILNADSSLAALGTVKPEGPYINIFLSKGAVTGKTLATIIGAGESWGKTDSFAGKRVMVEFLVLIQINRSILGI